MLQALKHPARFVVAALLVAFATGDEVQLRFVSPAAATESAKVLPPASKEFQDCSGCPVMVAVAPGSFTMGTPEGFTTLSNGSSYGQPDELPQHKVIIGNKFAMGKYEVTVAEYRKFAEDTKRVNSNTCETVASVEAGLPKLGVTKDHDWRKPGFDQTERNPVVCVRFEDAQAYVQWLSAKTGKQYRLPSEAEWEYAARAGTSTLWSWGNDPNQSCKYANLGDIKGRSEFSAWKSTPNCDDGYVYTAPVGSYAANAFGLYDVEGNVREWTEDCDSDSYKGIPADGSASHDGDCDYRIARGGVWFCNLTCNTETIPARQINNVQPAAAARPANRDRDSVGFRGFYVGFRVARSE